LILAPEPCDCAELLTWRAEWHADRAYLIMWHADCIINFVFHFFKKIKKFVKVKKKIRIFFITKNNFQNFLIFWNIHFSKIPKFIVYEKYIFKKILIFHKFLKLLSKILKYIFQNFYFKKKVQIIFENLEIYIFRKRSFLNFLNKKKSGKYFYF